MTPRSLSIRFGVTLALILPVVLVKIGLLAPSPVFPAILTESFNFAEWVNAVEAWLRSNLRWLTRDIADVMGRSLKATENALLALPWVVVMLGVVLPALRFGGLRLALFCGLAVICWGMVDMWQAAIETLSLMGMSVLLAVVLGVGLGLVCSQSNIAWSLIRPVLDTMQTMPTFVYLIPAIFFFGLGDPPAVAATIIYALPPAVRLTNLGIRQVSAETVEAARAFGSTTLQTLLKVQLPLALPSIMLGINQTVMMALGMVVIATFIGAGGLGYEVWSALRRIKVGWSLEAGLCIVLMAIVFDRLGYAISRGNQTIPATSFKLLPQRLRGRPWAQRFEGGLSLVYTAGSAASQGLTKLVAAVLHLATRFVIGRARADSLLALVQRHAFFTTSVLVLVALVVIDRYLVSYGAFPESWNYSIREPVDTALDNLKRSDGFYAFTTWIRATVFHGVLDPLSELLEWLPWWYFTALVGLLAWRSVGLVVALISVGFLLFIGAVELWPITMFTLASIFTSVLLCFLIGIPLGILSACSDVVEAMLRPVLDVMQTMPPFVYLVPVLMFFGANVVSGVIATVVYALPPVIRLTNLGIREVSVEWVEVARSFGSTGLQTLTKVQLPLALPSVMLGVNQAVIFAVAMTIITPLIGGAGLGREVFTALSRVDTGLGFEAGLSIVFLAIVLDRITQAWSRRRQAALGL